MAGPTVTASMTLLGSAGGVDATHAPLVVVNRGAGVGIAIKVAAGNKRALRPVVASVLELLQLIDAKCRAELADGFSPAVTNYRGNATGRIMSSVVLDKMFAGCS